MAPLRIKGVVRENNRKFINMKKILVSTISFVNRNKEGSEIYTTFAKRLINDVITKTPFDILVSTNETSFFNDVDKTNRITIRECDLGSHKTNVKAFNQLLKFYSIKDIPKEYEWVMYLDCDAGFTTQINVQEITNYLDHLETQGFDMSALRTSTTYDTAKKEYIESGGKASFPKPLFNDKFIFYGINDEWSGAKLPSEHILLIKNNDKLSKMCEIFEQFCYKFETQDPNNVITFDMEAFEIGVSAKLSGYNVAEMTWERQNELFKVGFNFNNWEKIKR